MPMRGKCWRRPRIWAEPQRTASIFAASFEGIEYFLGTLEDFLGLLALRGVGLPVWMVASAKGPARFNNQPNRRIGGQRDPCMGATIGRRFARN